MNFLEWNPHIFPSVANETRMKELADRMRPLSWSTRLSESSDRDSFLSNSFIKNPSMNTSFTKQK